MPCFDARAAIRSASIASVAWLLGACNELLGDVRVGVDPAPDTQRLSPELGASPALDPPDAAPSAPPDVDAGRPPSPGAVCEPGEFRCDGGQLLYCVDPSAWLVWQVCGSAALCASEPAGRCLPQSCEAGEQRCDGSLLQRCNTTLDGWDTVAECATAAHCDPAAEACLVAPCELEQRRCNRGELQRCRADQLDWDVLTTCTTQALCRRTLARCDESPDTCAGDVPACDEPVCEPEQKDCNGARLRQCNRGRTGWTLLERCASAGLCQASVSGPQASCTPPACSDGELRCEASELQRCSADGTGFERVQRCPSAALCDAEAERCEQPACDAGTYQCTADGELSICNPDQTGFVAQTPPVVCDAAELCDAERGRCRRRSRDD
ncbi:MAG TPA: hypothetical protein VMG12_42070 [Polyangiaceae bacterium]|nr:hypothetical protein [Polyangiaceae bacterium]